MRVRPPKPRRKRAPRRRIIEPDFGIAVERAVKELDAAGDPDARRHSAKVLRAVLMASEREDAERTWS